MTHRAVARAAGVPLGSTTYHFSNREELLEAAMRAATLDAAASLRAWSEQITSTEQLVPALVDLLASESSSGRDRVVVAYELYVAAMKRPSLQPAAAAWSEILRAEISRHTDPVTGAALAAAADGMLLTTLATGGTLRRDETERILRRVAT
jgi:DNA-binding transcriptional regulator YbjK